MSNEITRRGLLAGTAALTASVASGGEREREPFSFCLNTSTIRGQNLGIVEMVGIAARAGYQGIEPWMSDLERYVREGNEPRDLARRVQDAGLRVENAIGFAEWIVDDDARRRRGLENARRDMDLVQRCGGRRIAAPPAGATDQANLNLGRATERYRALCDIGQQIGVVPMVELWGFSRSLSRLGEVAYVAIESGHPQACILADVYHIHKGGSPFGGIRQINGAAQHVFHMNDYPEQPPRATIGDEHRVYPGDGVAPLRDLLRDLRRAGYRGVLSLEVFNRDYWRQDALTVARTGLEKMRAVARASMEQR